MAAVSSSILTPSAATHVGITSLAAFSVPALALWLPSGYAYGTALLFIGALLATPHWLKHPVPPAARWLLAAIAVMGLIWLHGSDWHKGASVLNKPLRYLMALPCLLYVLRFPPRRDYLLAGIAMGAAFGGLRALYDIHVMGLDRPWTSAEQTGNAIQLGNLSGMLGLMCWIQLMVYWRRWGWPLRLAVLACCGLGLLGSLLSQTRGGWLALALCLPVLFWLLARRVSGQRALAGMAVLCVLLLPLGWHMAPKLGERFQWAVADVNTYERSGDANTSIGQRLDHWKLAWRMGLDRPLTGWGEAGYAEEKKRRVAGGQAHPVVLGFSHTHNEVLDQFVKRGLIGVAGLLVLYLVPLALFWPRRRASGAPQPADAREDDMCLRLIGLAVPLTHMGFGLTQVFFAHYNGVVIYLDMVVLVFAALHAPAAGAAAPGHRSPQKKAALAGRP